MLLPLKLFIIYELFDYLLQFSTTYTADEQYTTDIILTHIRLTALCPGLPRWAGTRR